MGVALLCSGLIPQVTSAAVTGAPTVVSGEVVSGGGIPPQVAAVAAVPETTSATITGEITDLGSSSVIERGLVYGTTGAYGATTTETGSFSTGPYSLTLTDLTCATTYHYANYAANKYGTSYGVDRTFTTDACPVPVAAPTQTSQSNSVISPLVLTTAGAAGAVAIGAAAFYSPSISRFFTNIVLGLLAWLAYFGAAKALKKKKIGVIGTHHAYVLVGDALDEAVVERVYRLKGAAPQTSYPILISAWEELERFGVALSDTQKEVLAKKYWPGPVDVVLPSTGSRFAYLHQGAGKLVFRYPADFLTLSLLRRTGPLLAPTANPEGLPVATTILEAKQYFEGKVDFFVNKGTLEGLVPTRIELTEAGEVTVLSEGTEELSM